MFNNWKAVEEFLLSRSGVENNDGRLDAKATKEEIEEVAGVELRFNDELKIEDPDLITLMWTKRPPLPDGTQEEVVDFDHRVNRGEGKEPVRITVILN